MPYGKYKRRTIAGLPGDYFNSFTRGCIPNGEIVL